MILFILLIILVVFLAIKGSSIKGKVGESIVANLLESIPGYKHVINDIMINDNGKSRQIDHILLCENGIFVIETKNYAGKIYGKETSNEWKQYLNNKEFRFKNPIFQNYAHQQIVSKVIENEKDIIPIVVFTTRSLLKIETKNSIVLYTNQLLNYINSKEKTLTSTEIDKYYQKIISNKITDEETIKSHSTNVRSYVKYKNDLANNRICPRCSGNLVIRNGKNGKFLGCSNYPKCKYTKSL